MKQKITSWLCDLNLPKTSIVHDDNSNIAEILSKTLNYKSNGIFESISINNLSVQNISEENISDSGATKNEMLQVLIQDTMWKHIISLNDIPNMIITYDGNLFQNEEVKLYILNLIS